MNLSYNLIEKKSLKKLRYFLTIIISILIGIMMCFNTVSVIQNSNFFHFGIYGFLIVIAGLFIFSAVKKKETLFKFLSVLTISIFIGYLFYFIAERLNIIDKINSFNSLKEIILKSGNFGRLVFLIINILQVVLLPIPGVVSIAVGTILYGPWQTLFLSTSGIVIGSIMAFLIGRKFGFPLACWIFSKELIIKYQKILSNKTGILLFLMFVLPFFPDDMLCVLAGLTDISFKKFAIITLTARAISVFVVAILASGIIIPFTGWGIVVWLILGVIILIAGILGFINRKKLKTKVSTLFKK